MSKVDNRRCGRCRAALRSSNTYDLCDPCLRRATDDALHLSPAFYQQAAVVRALRTYDFGSFFRLIRGALDLTQEELGLLIGLAQSQICKIEKGTLPLRDVETIVRLATTFALPTDLLGFGSHQLGRAHTPPAEDGAPRSRRDWRNEPLHSAPTVRETETTPADGRTADRSPWAKDVLGTAPSTGDRVDKVTLLASVQLLTELADNESSATLRIGPPEVERLRQHVALFELVVWRIGGAELRHLVTEYIVRLTRLVRRRTFESAVRVQLNRILAELHRMAGWMHLHSEDHATARQHWDAGVRAADRGRNGALVARILDGRSQQLCQLNRYDEALSTIRQARRIAEGVAAPAVMAMLIGRTEAWIYAEKGLRQHALTAIGRAKDVYGDAHAAEDLPWALWFDEAQLLSAEGHCLKILAIQTKEDARRAAELIAKSIRLMPSRAEHSRRLNLPGLASALVLAGELDEAAAVFRRAMDDAGAAESPETRARLRREYRRHAASVGRHPGLRDVGRELGATEPN